MTDDTQAQREGDGELVCPECGTRIPLTDPSVAEGLSEMKCPNCGAQLPPPPAGT
jgi:DNA-directed RNA polymerase subunit RPC12/RpoP